MPLVEIIALVISSGVVLEVTRAVIRAVRLGLQKRGHVQTEMDALKQARQQWIERTYAVRSASLAGDPLPELDKLDAYDLWRQSKHHPQPD